MSIYKYNFQKIAEQEDAIFMFNEDTIDLGNGSRDFDMTYHLSLEYKDRTINIINKTGTTGVGRVVCIISSSQKDSLVFEMITRSHFVSLFFKNRYKLKTQNPNIKYFLRHSKSFKEMKDIAKRTSFEPTIIGENSEEGFELIIEYHLQFPDWTEVILPIISFYKEFIDRFI